MKKYFCVGICENEVCFLNCSEKIETKLYSDEYFSIMKDKNIRKIIYKNIDKIYKDFNVIHLNDIPYLTFNKIHFQNQILNLFYINDDNKVISFDIAKLILDILIHPIENFDIERYTILSILSFINSIKYTTNTILVEKVTTHFSHLEKEYILDIIDHLKINKLI